MYSDQKFYARVDNHIVGSNTSTANATNGANVTGFTQAMAPKYFRKTAINKVRVGTITAAAAGVTGLSIQILNGTDTFATVTPAAAGSYADATLTAGKGTFAADSTPTYNFVGTATASGLSLGLYRIDLEVQESFS